ncbi:Protein of unknown function [Bacillus mycoides]|uniref:Uncharacterized protein n=1 Tax=Bacillus mycoides TaxID=1405 RepID=A0A1G4EWP8_BACMY|nr:Protein of unknown function [Bacillus mycoides]
MLVGASSFWCYFSVNRYIGKIVDIFEFVIDILAKPLI